MGQFNVLESHRPTHPHLWADIAGLKGLPLKNERAARALGQETRSIALGKCSGNSCKRTTHLTRWVLVRGYIVVAAVPRRNTSINAASLAS